MKHFKFFNFFSFKYNKEYDRGNIAIDALLFILLIIFIVLIASAMGITFSEIISDFKHFFGLLILMGGSAWKTNMSSYILFLLLC